MRRLISEAEQKLAQDQNMARSRTSDRSQEAGQAESEQQELALLQEKEEIHEQLVAENKKLKSNLAACESNLQGYISEMNALLDQHELGSLLGAALMPQEPELVAMAAGAPQHQRQTQQPGGQSRQHDQNSNDDQLYSS